MGSTPFEKSISSLLVLNRREVRTCHVFLPNDPRPISAIRYQNRYYSYLKFYPTAEPAEQAARRLIVKVKRWS